MSTDSPKNEPKKPRRTKKKPQARTKTAQSTPKKATDDAMPATPPAQVAPTAGAWPEVGPRLDVPLAVYDEQARGTGSRPVAFRVVPWAMLAVAVIFVFSSLRSVMTAPVAKPTAKVHATPTVSAVYRKYQSKAKFRIKVTTPRLNLRAQPAVYSALLLRIPKGTVLLVMKKKGDWYRIVAPTGNRGWVNANPAYSKVVKK